MAAFRRLKPRLHRPTVEPELSRVESGRFGRSDHGLTASRRAAKGRRLANDRRTDAATRWVLAAVTPTATAAATPASPTERVEAEHTDDAADAKTRNARRQ